MFMKTYSLKKEDVTRSWFVLDASDKVLGRLATKIADRIRGKDKPSFTPHTDGGDYVIVVNAEKIKVTGSKSTDKKYYTHSLYPGGLKTRTFKDLNEKNPEKIIENAVKGMLPKNKLRKEIIKKLKVFKGPNHDHESQKPINWNPTI
jgi:large subunit ribosomal protein L13